MLLARARDRDPLGPSDAFLALNHQAELHRAKANLKLQ
jgi:hypothetical protein